MRIEEVLKEDTTTTCDSALSDGYRGITRCLDFVTDELCRREDFCERACLLILEDDLTLLMEECEEYIVCGPFVDAMTIHSFESRCGTVITEVLEFLQKRVLENCSELSGAHRFS